MIPKIIWQTHNYKYDELPSHLIKYTKNWQNLNPGWTYNYVDHEQRSLFVKKYLPDIHEKYYLNCEPMYQADIWRYAVIYKYGGVYADMDSYCIKPLDYMLEGYSGQDIIFTLPQQDGTINNANFAAVKQSISIKQTIELIMEKSAVKPNENLRTLDSFSEIMNKKDAKIWFDAASHSQAYKEDFFELDIDYYGKTMSYRDYLKNILKLKETHYKLCIN